MPDRAVDQRSRYPLAAYNFRVTVAGVAMGFSEVSGLALEYETVTYRHGLSFLEGESLTKFRFDKYVPVTLKKGVVQTVTTLRDWLEQAEPRPVDITLCDEKGDPAVTWHIGKAVAVKLEAPAFNAAGNEAAIESLELRVTRITVVHH